MAKKINKTEYTEKQIERLVELSGIIESDRKSIAVIRKSVIVGKDNDPEIINALINVFEEKIDVLNEYRKILDTIPDQLSKEQFDKAVENIDKEIKQSKDTLKILYDYHRDITSKLPVKSLDMSSDDIFYRLLAMAKSIRKTAHKIVNISADSRDNVIAENPLFADWMKTEDDYISLADQSYIALADIQKKYPNMKTGKAIFRAVWNSVRVINRNEYKSVSALVRVITDSEEEEKFEVDFDSFESSDSLPNPEDYTVFVTTLEECCKDYTDRFIIAERIEGFSCKDIGVKLGISRQSVEKRLHNIYDRLKNSQRMTDRELNKAVEETEYLLNSIDIIYNKDIAEFRKNWINTTEPLKAIYKYLRQWHNYKIATAK